MGERTREERATFQHAFSFPGVEEQAPGTYEVEIVEETIDTLSFVAYHPHHALRVVGLTTFIEEAGRGELGTEIAQGSSLAADGAGPTQPLG